MKQYYIKSKGKFKRVNPRDWNFPTKPADGIWLVKHDGSSCGYSCIVRLADLPKTHDIANKLALSVYRDKIVRIISDRDMPISNNERANKIIDLICSKKEG